MHDRLVKGLSTVHKALFRASGGLIGRKLGDNDMAILTTTGRVTGKAHAVPLLVLADGIDWIIIASYGGRPHHPEWYLNLLAAPTATLQIGTSKVTVVASTLTGGERAAWWPRIVQAYESYAEYASRTDRQIPVVRLVRDP